MTRLVMLFAGAWMAVAVGHTVLTAGLALPELSARAATLARW